MKISLENTENMQRYITALESLGESGPMGTIGDIIAENTKPFIPTDTGKMANNYIVNTTKNACVVDWNTGALPYTQYQFYGRVMGPNKAIFGAQGPNKAGPGAGVHSGWVSPVKPKKLRNRMMGTPATITLNDGRVIHIKGYTTKGTGPRWTKEALKNKKSYSKIRFESGRYLYEAYCFATGSFPVGGYQIMGKYL
jgi:hypothetical protein